MITVRLVLVLVLLAAPLVVDAQDQQRQFHGWDS